MVREHQFNDLGWCTHCGAASVEKLRERYGDSPKLAGEDGRLCVQRPNPAPEPRRRTYASEDFDAIAVRVEELRRIAVTDTDEPELEYPPPPPPA